MANLMALDEMAERHLLIMGESPYEVDVDEMAESYGCLMSAKDEFGQWLDANINDMALEELVEIINGAIGLEKLLAAVRLKADLFCNRMLSGLEDHVSATPETLIRQLDIPWRVVVALYRADVKRVGQLRELTVTDVMRIARIGEKSGALLAPYLNPDQSSVTLLNE